MPDLYQAQYGIQRMSEVGEENGPKIGQQFSAVRMTVCFTAQELEQGLAGMS